MKTKWSHRFTRLNLCRLEDRLVPAQILFQSNVDSSYATVYGRPLPDQTTENSAIFDDGYVVVGSDYRGNPIDFNQDGLSDLISIGSVYSRINYQNPDTSVNAATYINQGSGYISSPAQGLINVMPWNFYGIKEVKTNSMAYATAIDLNKDGFQDILCYNGEDQIIKYLWNPDTGIFADPVSCSTISRTAMSSVGCGQLQLSDVNKDGYPDMVLPNYPAITGALTGFSVYLASPGGDGSWSGAFQTNPIATLPLMVPDSQAWTVWGAYAINQVNAQFGDFNRDGNPDIAFVDGTGISLYLNPGNGQFDPAAGVHFNSFSSQQGANLQMGDFNQDGYPDLVSTPNFIDDAGDPGPISIYMNSTGSSGGTVSFTLGSNVGMGNDYNGSLAVADFNLDGILDLAVTPCQFGANRAMILEGFGDGTFGNPSIILGYGKSADKYRPDADRFVSGIATGDTNGDGLPDLITSAGSSRAVGITGISINTTFPVPGATPAILNPAIAGQPYSQSLGHTGGNPSQGYIFSLNANSTRLPAGITLSPNGLISGTTTQVGYYQLLVDVSQPNGMHGSTLVDLKVTNAQPGVLTISPATLPNATAGVAYSQQLSTTGSTGTVSYAIDAGTLPAGISLSPSGLISGTPTSTGVASFTVSATDAAGNIGYRPYTLTTGTNPTPPLAGPFIAAGSGQGGLVSIFNANGTPRQSFAPYGTGYKGAVTVAQGDVNGDGVADLVTGTGAGVAPHVLVLDGNTLAVIGSFYAYAEQFLGGVRVAAGDVDGDGRAEVVTGTGPGSAPNVCVFNGTTGATQQSFYAYAPEYRGGINVAAGDVTGDGKADIVTGSGVGVSPHVVVFDGVTQQALYSFYAYLPGFKGGVNVGVADVDNDGKADILTGAAPGADPHVKVFSGADGTQKQSFDAFATSFNGGVSVAGADLNGDGKADLIAGTQTQSAQVKAFNATDLSVLDDFFAFQGEVGVWVAGSR